MAASDPYDLYLAHVGGCDDCYIGLCPQRHALYALIPKDRLVEEREAEMASWAASAHRRYTLDPDTWSPRWLTAREAAEYMTGLRPDLGRAAGPGGTLCCCVDPDAPYEAKVRIYLEEVEADREAGLVYRHRGVELSSQEAAELMATHWTRRRVTRAPAPRELRAGESWDDAVAEVKVGLRALKLGGGFVDLYTEGDRVPPGAAS